jgi:glycosyltransferase involved in cell wall biosynthesis
MICVVCFTGDSGLTDYSASLCKELEKHTNIELITAESYDDNRYRTDFPVRKIFRRSRHYPIDLIRFIVYILRRKPRWVLFQSTLKVAWVEAILVTLIRQTGIRCAITIHDLLPHYPRRWSALEMRFFYTRFDALIVHSDRQARNLKALGVKTRPLVVPHGVYDIFNLDHLTQTQARSYFPAMNSVDFIALFFGHLEERKGILEFIECADQMTDHPDIKFLVAGKPENSPSVKSALDRARTLPNIIMADHMIPHDEVQRYVAASDIVVLPYREGTTSGVIKLAMAFSKPVLCTDVGDFPETLENWPGLLIERAHLTHDLAAKVLESKTDYGSLTKSITATSKDIQWATIAERYYRFLNGIDQI